MNFRYLFVPIFYFLISEPIFSQDGNQTNSTEKNTPILFAEMIIGWAGGSASGPTIGTTVNYQKEKHLFSVRYINQIDFSFDVVPIGFVPFPVLSEELRLNEFSALYGRRNYKEGRSFSYSAGISFNHASYRAFEGNIDFKQNETFFGFPFELNLKWFKAKRKRFRAYYGIIPIGKPTSFGRSVGFKFYGNIGKFTYVGVGINYGFGWHKKY